VLLPGGSHPDADDQYRSSYHLANIGSTLLHLPSITMGAGLDYDVFKSVLARSGGRRSRFLAPVAHLPWLPFCSRALGHCISTWALHFAGKD
jgi:hypothetical protein